MPKGAAMEEEKLVEVERKITIHYVDYELEKISKILQDVSKHLAPQTNIARASSLLFLNRVLHQITYQNLLT